MTHLRRGYAVRSGSVVNYTGAMVIPAPPETVIQKIVLWGSGEKNTTSAVSGGTVIFTHQSTPGWAIVLAVLLFPIGLLFLLAKRTDVLTLIAVPIEGGTQVSATGMATPFLGSRLNALLGNSLY